MKSRNSNIELLRIILMILIVAHHYVVHSGLIDIANATPTINGKTIFLQIFGAWGKTAINCFVLITGYFMCKSTITLSKFFKLVCEILFYNILISCIFIIFGKAELSAKLILVEWLPIIRLNSRFIGAFLFLYLLIPFLNIFIKNLSQKQHGYLVLLLLTTQTVLSVLPYMDIQCDYLLWFPTIYLLSSYIRFYENSFRIVALGG